MWNEPLLHPDIARMMEYVIKKNQRVYITTNGTIWNQDLFELIMEKNSCYQLIISLDGLPGSKSIGKCRPGSTRKIINNIYKLITLQIKKGINNIDLCLKICQRGQDWEEIENFIYYWLKSGVDYICVGRMLNQSGSDMRIYPCQYFDDQFMLIRVDGELVPCMYNRQVAIDNYFRIGKLNETEDLIEAYNHLKLTRLRKDQNRGIFHGPCKTCNSAYTGQGFRGQYQFNDPRKKDIGILYSSQDYYNQTFSLKDIRR